MKIRWNTSSVRFRITPSELTALENGDAIQETLLLPTGAAWSTRIVPNAANTSLAFENGALLLYLSDTDLAELLVPHHEGVYFRDDDFRFFIEKDFPCAHPRASEAAEPATETFAPPPGFEQRKTS